MAKYMKDIVLNQPEQFVQFMMNDYLQKNKFKNSTWKKQPALRAGDGFFEAYKYMNWSYQNGVLHLEAWLRGSFGGEMGLDGAMGFLATKPYKESLETLINLLQQPIPEGGLDENGMPTQVIQVQTVDDTKAATMALVFGIVAVVSSFISRIIGIIFAGLGFTRGRMGSCSSKAGMAKAGTVLSIIGMIIAFAMWMLSAILRNMVM